MKRIEKVKRNGKEKTGPNGKSNKGKERDRKAN